MRDLYGASQKNDFLEEDISNLGLMLNKLRAGSTAKAELLRHLKMFYAGAEDVLTPIQGGLVDLRIEEENGITIPASRLSDGTLRWLSLLTILLHPEPPPLVCIEEPELGLHSDMIQPLAKLLISAAERMQLIVTTHSDDLIDEMSGNPEAVIVCEKHSGSSVSKHLDGDRLSEWLERYRLGQLWRTGEIGGEPLVSVRLSVEGGFEGSTKSNCRKAFGVFFGKVVVPGSFKVIASVSRSAAFQDFCSALRQHPEDYVILLVDSETAVTSPPWQHLRAREGDQWPCPSGTST